MTSGVEMHRLLGANLTSAEIHSIKSASSWEIKAFPSSGKLRACQYHTCKERGVQLCFEEETPGAQLLLSAVHFYNEGTNGFSRFQGEPLPFGLSMTQTNQEVVAMLGEPDSKGGVSVPVWIAYQAKALQVNFKGFSFDDTSNPIVIASSFHASIALYQSDTP